MHAAERDGQAGDAQHGGAAREIGWFRALFAACGNRGGRIRRADHGSFVYPPVDVAGHALRVLLQGEDQQHPAGQQEPVPVQPEPLVERVRDQGLGGQQASEHRTGDERDAARVGERDQAERGHRVEPVSAHRAEVVRVQHAADAGDERGDAERVQLHGPRVDRRGGGRPLVGAHREHPLPERAAAQVPDPDAQQHAADQHDQAEDRAGLVAVDAAERAVRAEVEPEPLRLGYRRAGQAAAPGAVDEAEVLDGDGAGQRDHGQAHAADPDRGDRGNQADHHRDHDARERRDRERDAEIDGHVRDREPGGTGQRELDHRDLADEADHHHERQRHQRADQRIDQRLAEVEREHDQEHRADERADQPGADQVLRARRLR